MDLLFGAFRNSDRLLQSVLPLMNLHSFSVLAQAMRIRWVLLGRGKRYDTNSAINIHSPPRVCCRKQIDDALIFCEICIINFVCLAKPRARAKSRHDANVTRMCECGVCALHAYSFLALSWFRFFFLVVYFCSANCYIDWRRSRRGCVCRKCQMQQQRLVWPFGS